MIDFKFFTGFKYSNAILFNGNNMSVEYNEFLEIVKIAHMMSFEGCGIKIIVHNYRVKVNSLDTFSLVNNGPGNVHILDVLFYEEL